MRWLLLLSIVVGFVLPAGARADATLPVEGFFIDLNYWWGDMGGAIMLADTGDGVTGVGSYDSFDFFRCRGNFSYVLDDRGVSTRMLTVDWNAPGFPHVIQFPKDIKYPPTGTPLSLEGTVVDLRTEADPGLGYTVEWRGPRNRWFTAYPPLLTGSITKLDTPPSDEGNIEGVYVDLRVYANAGFGGVRMLAEDADGTLTVAGSEDGVAFWHTSGRRATRTTFAVSGLPNAAAELIGRLSPDRRKIVWSDGSTWQRSVLEIPSPSQLGPSARRQPMGWGKDQPMGWGNSPPMH